MAIILWGWGDGVAHIGGGGGGGGGGILASHPDKTLYFDSQP